MFGKLEAIIGTPIKEYSNNLLGSAKRLLRLESLIISQPMSAVNVYSNKSTYGIFNSRYRPLIFKVRFICLKKLGKGKCPEALTSPEDKARYERNYLQ